jgi:methanogen homocitrate synthase
LHKPIVGRHTFARETGAGIEMLEKTPLAVFPMKPEFGGNSSKVLIGKKSGGNSIKVKLSEWNIQGYNDDQVDEIVKRVKELSSIKKGLVSDEELKEIIRTVIDYC